jgi:hypothetical protein
MRFMMIIYPKGYESAAPGTLPDTSDMAKMMAYNESLGKAGVLLALDGLQPPSMGARVSFSGGKATVTDGPFAEAKETVGGFWILQVKSKAEAIEWAKRAPMKDNETLELRKIFEFSDFAPEEIDKAAEGLPGVQAKVERARKG